MQSASRRHRQRLLGEAFEQGIRHFDVARMYGLGVAESELGRFAQRRRDRIAIATKFGIEPSGPAARLASLQAPARAAVARLPALRARLKRRERSFHQPRRYDAATARASLETSLRALGTDYVDLFFVHDPGPEDCVDMAELSEALEELRRAGYVRAWGIAGEAEPCVGLAGSVDAPAVLQVRDDIFGSGLRRAGGSAITFGVLSGAAKRVVDHVSSGEGRRSNWRRAVGEDCGDPQAVAALLLRDALDRNRGGRVLFSTTHPERVGAAVAATAPPSERQAQALRAFRRCIQAELIGGARIDD
jgi:aryl-alcohol dehydrogenase-like predicted oxidoreductase